MAFPYSENPSFAPMSIDAEKLEQHRIWHRFSRWLGRDENFLAADLPKNGAELGHAKPSFGRRLSRKVVPGLPRPATFRRQNSERRERLTPVNPSGAERRALSMDRRRTRSLVPNSTTSLDLPPDMPRLSAAVTMSANPSQQQPNAGDQGQSQEGSGNDISRSSSHTNQPPQRPAPPPSPPDSDEIQPPEAPTDEDDMDEQIKQELEDKWILNLSMHFRDRSPREKFFVTYAETPTSWRRVTVSCDYRDAPPDSLERDLQSLQYQRDKSARIYEAIRTSLPDIQFYTTVTNLRLETSQDDRLHVHVTEDINEVIPYPSTNAVKHLDYPRVPEGDVIFDSHMSGFVYKVRVNNETFNNKVCIKKEIPGPDSVEEFLYEINALHALVGTPNVIQFQGLVVDEENDLVKGLLISYADQGPLVDLIYDFKESGILTWEKREKWARQIIQGLSEIHEAGFVQGDFTLSNIVIDHTDTAQIIDINRRGCPVGWEPPEIARMIDSGQRISMYIGVKSDLFQLGMVLWALIMEEDEPERQARPLKFIPRSDIPPYLLKVALICLSDNPKDRWSAQKLLSCFPDEASDDSASPLRSSLQTTQIHKSLPPSETQYIDPAAAVEREDIARHSHHYRRAHSRSESPTYVDRQSSLDLHFDGPGTYLVQRRGRTPPRNHGHLNYSNSYSYMSRPGASEDILGGVREPAIVPIDPIHRDTRWKDDWNFVDSEEDESEASQRRLRRRQRTGEDLDSDIGPERALSFIARAMDHVDSGLGDMDLTAIGLKDIGGNEGLTPHEIADDFDQDIDSAANEYQNSSLVREAAQTKSMGKDEGKAKTEHNGEVLENKGSLLLGTEAMGTRAMETGQDLHSTG